jgi:cathepsin E
MALRPTVYWGERGLLFMHIFCANTVLYSIGPALLNLGTLTPDKNVSIPTVTDNLFNEGAILFDLVSVFFEPTTTQSAQNGELRFGSIDHTKFTGNLTYM